MTTNTEGAASAGDPIVQDREEDPATEQQQEFQRFRITTEEDLNKWSMTDGMVQYVHDNFERYISEKDIKEGVLSNNPRPENLVPAKKLDDFLADLLKDRKKTQELAYEATLEKVSNKNLDVLGPLGKLWLSVDAINNYKQGHQEGEPPKLSVQDTSDERIF